MGRCRRGTGNLLPSSDSVPMRRTPMLVAGLGASANSESRSRSHRVSRRRNRNVV